MVKITNKIARRLADHFGIDLRKIPLKEWRYALKVELEHGTEYSTTNVTNDDLSMTAQIALAHLMEYPDYYSRLKQMEYEAKQYWDNKPTTSIFRKSKRF